MTDDEIIKALKCCSETTGSECSECPLLNADCSAYDLYKLALDLINRQNAEIERLLQKLQQSQSEAIKEFAEELKHFIIPQKADGYTREIVLKRDIDNLVKEMTEESE